MKVQVWVDIPDGYELACDEMRVPKTGELFISAYKMKVLTSCAEIDDPRVIVRPAWQWPSWLKAVAVAMDCDNRWFAHNDVPIATDYDWWCEESTGMFLCQKTLDFTPPPCADWRQSLRLNPNREVKS